MGIRLNKHKPNIYFKVRPHHLWAAVWAGLGLCRPVAEAPRTIAAAPSSASLPSPFFLQPKKGGGISFNSTVTLTQCSEKLVQLILHEYSILPERVVREGPQPPGQGRDNPGQEALWPRVTADHPKPPWINPSRLQESCSH